jgi:hypothetical protein
MMTVRMRRVSVVYSWHPDAMPCMFAMLCILMGWVPQRGTLRKVISLGRSYVWTILDPAASSTSRYLTPFPSRNLVFDAAALVGAACS